jgi:hypothetical protein
MVRKKNRKRSNMTNANNHQVDGNHYSSDIQHWDYVVANELDYFQAQVTKYVTRWKKKGGIRDLEKAQHFLEKYIEVEKAKEGLKNPHGLYLGKSPNKPLYPKNSHYHHPFGYNKEDECD